VLCYNLYTITVGIVRMIFILNNLNLQSINVNNIVTCRYGFECGHHMGWFRVVRGGAACTLVLVYMSIRLSESQ
jgi:hypothetical protein